VVPVTPCLLLLDPVTVYLRAADLCPRTGRALPGATGRWQPLPSARVKARLEGHFVVVVVE
jgi:hypothetical protein